MSFIRRWWAERRFDREHRPYLTTRVLPPDRDTGYQSPLMGIYCTKHDCFFGECP